MNAIITAATKGIGRAIAYKLAQAGYNIAVCSRNQSEVDTFCTEIREIFKVEAIGLQTDCSSTEQLERFAGFVQQHFHTVDVLVNNAGMYIPGNILDEPDGLLGKQMKVNVNAAYFMSRFFGKQMRDARSGHIINICSVAALKPDIRAGSYSVTKYALLGLTRVLREEMMPSNVKVTAILPGSTFTESWSGTDLKPGRFVAPDDIANAVLMCINASGGANVDELIVTPAQGQI